jgi:hypothetical protein
LPPRGKELLPGELPGTSFAERLVEIPTGRGFRREPNLLLRPEFGGEKLNFSASHREEKIPVYAEDGITPEGCGPELFLHSLGLSSGILQFLKLLHLPIRFRHLSLLTIEPRQSEMSLRCERS